MSIFAETCEVIQKLLHVVQRFIEWCGMEINVKQTFLLVMDKNQKRRKEIPAPELEINSERLRTINLDHDCQYLGYCGTGNGDMSVTKEVVQKKGRSSMRLHQMPPALARTGHRTVYN